MRSHISKEPIAVRTRRHIPQQCELDTQRPRGSQVSFTSWVTPAHFEASTIREVKTFCVHNYFPMFFVSNFIPYPSLLHLETNPQSLNTTGYAFSSQTVSSLIVHKFLAVGKSFVCITKSSADNFFTFTSRSTVSPAQATENCVRACVHTSVWLHSGLLLRWILIPHGPIELHNGILRHVYY
jgi:hypothetical protein